MSNSDINYNNYKIRLSPYHKIFYNEWKLNPDSGHYNIVFDQTLSSNLDIPKLKIALYKFVSDYILFNSHIMRIDEELFWVKNSQVKELEYFEDYKQRIYNYVKKPFDLENGILYRFAVFKKSSEDYRFVIVLHHILIGGKSFDSLITEISEYYNEDTYTAKINLEKQVEFISYMADDLYWQLKLHVDESKTFWLNKLSNIDPLELRFMKNTSDVKLESLTKELSFNFTEKVYYKLDIFRKKYRFTSYYYSQIIFAILLYKYTYQNKFVISYPISIKKYKELFYGAQINVRYPYNCTLRNRQSV